jgi:hypothetical protein
VSSSSSKALVLIAVVALVAAGCGGGKKRNARQDVANYVQRVNRIETQMRTPLLGVEKAYRRFTTRNLVQSQPRLARAEKTLRTLERRLKLVPPPPEARRLHRLLLQLLSREVGIAHEVVQLADFLPAFDSALRPLAPAGARLAQSLTAAQAPQPRLVRGTKKQLARARARFKAQTLRAQRAQAAAIDLYLGEVRDVERRLRALDPPAVMAPTRDAELSTLVRVETSGAALARALANGEGKKIAALDLRYREAARGGSSIAQQRAQIAAIKAYDRRARNVLKLSIRVQRELARLDRTLHS